MKILLLLLASISFAQNYSATLSWDPVLNTQLSGYNVYYGIGSGNYTNRLFAGTNTVTTVSNLLTGVVYYFAVTSENIEGLESDYSAEVSFIKPSQNSIPLTLVFKVPKSGNYIIQATRDLTNSNGWSSVSPPIRSYPWSSGNAVSMFIYIDSNVPTMFYRAKLSQ